MNTLRFTLPAETTLDSVRKFLLHLQELGLLYHIDDDPFDIYQGLRGPRLFTDAECYALIGFWTLVQSRLSWDQVWEEAYPETNTD